LEGPGRQGIRQFRQAFGFDPEQVKNCVPDQRFAEGGSGKFCCRKISSIVSSGMTGSPTPTIFIILGSSPLFPNFC
jgi:hypothetical protein